MSDVMQRPALVLNRHWRPVHVTSVVRALVLLWNDSARVVDPLDYRLYGWDDWAALEPEFGEPVLRTTRGPLRVPEVIGLSRFDRMPATAVTFSRRNVAKRDHQICQYCGAQPGWEAITVDHVVPARRAVPRAGRTASPPAHRATDARPTARPSRPACGSASPRPGPSGNPSSRPARRAWRAGRSSSTTRRLWRRRDVYPTAHPDPLPQGERDQEQHPPPLRGRAGWESQGRSRRPSRTSNPTDAGVLLGEQRASNPRAWGSNPHAPACRCGRTARHPSFKRRHAGSNPAVGMRRSKSPECDGRHMTLRRSETRFDSWLGDIFSSEGVDRVLGVSNSARHAKVADGSSTPGGDIFQAKE